MQFGNIWSSAPKPAPQRLVDRLLTDERQQSVDDLHKAVDLGDQILGANIRLDARIPEKRQKFFWELFHQEMKCHHLSEPANVLRHIFAHYHKTYVAQRQSHAFDQTYNQPNLIDLTDPANEDLQDKYAIRLFNVTKMVSALADPDIFEKYIFRREVGNPPRLLLPAIQEAFNGTLDVNRRLTKIGLAVDAAMSVESARVVFIEDLLHFLALLPEENLNGETDQMHKPFWVSIWEDFEDNNLLDAKDSDSTISRLGLESRAGDWWIAFKYQMLTCKLARPSLLDANAYVVHHPSCATTPISKGGRPLDLSDKHDLEIREYIHNYVSLTFDMWKTAGTWAKQQKKTSPATRTDLSAIRSRHRQRFVREFGEIDPHV